MMKLLLALLIPTTLMAGPWKPYVEGRVRYGDYREGASLHGFCPLIQSECSIGFAEGRFARMRDQWTGGIGGGYRRLLGNCFGAGVAGFVDVSHAKQTYAQGTISGELFYNCWELNANGYLLNNKRYQTDQETFFRTIIQGTQVFDQTEVITDFENAYRGFDVNLGYTMCVGCGYLRGWAGLYRYEGQDRGTIFGPRLRARYELDIMRHGRIFAGGDWQYDSPRGSQGAIYGGLRIPIGGKCCKKCCQSVLYRRMGDLVDRDLGMVIRKKRIVAISNDFLTNLLFFMQNGTGPGTQTNPNNVVAVEVASVPGDILFALNNNGPVLMTDPLDMKDNQELYSFDSVSEVEIDVGGFFPITITDLTGDGKATLDGQTVTDIITLANGNTIFGLALNNGIDAITGTSVGDVLIDQVMVMDATTHGIILTTPGAVTINDSTISAITGSNAGVTVATSPLGSLVAFTGTNTIDNAGGNGLFLNANDGDITMEQIDITVDSGAALFAINNTGSVGSTTGTLTATNGPAVDIFGTTTIDLNFASVSSSDSTQPGLRINGATGDFTIAGRLDITDAGDDGVALSGAHTLTVNGGGQITYAAPVAFSGIDMEMNASVDINGVSALDRFTINNTGTGVQASDATAIGLNFVEIGNANDAIDATDTLDSVAFTNGFIHDLANGNDAITIDNGNHSGVFALTVTDSTIEGNGTNFMSTRDGIDLIFDTTTAANITADISDNIFNGVFQGMLLRTRGESGRNCFTINDNTFTELENDAIEFSFEDNSITEVVIDNNSMTGFGILGGNPERGIQLQPRDFAGTGLFTITNNTIQDFRLDGMQLNQNLGSAASGLIDIVVEDNTVDNITSASGEGFELEAGNGNTVNMTVQRNTVTNTARGIEATHDGSAVNTTINLALFNNTAPAYNLISDAPGVATSLFNLVGTLGQGMTFSGTDNGNVANNGNTGATTVIGDIVITAPFTPTTRICP